MADRAIRVTTQLGVTYGPYGTNEMAQVYLTLNYPGVTAEVDLDELGKVLDEQLGSAVEMAKAQLDAWYRHHHKAAQNDRSPEPSL